MRIPESIFLVGPMGSGKSAVGSHLARSLKVDFFDSDREIERRCGADIPHIFEHESESGFRRRETQVLEELTRLPDIVLATGGGAVLEPRNRANLLTHGLVVYLRCCVEQQLERTSRGNHRPLLNQGDPHRKLTEFFHTRDPLYREVADLIIDTDNKTVHQAVLEIIKYLKSQPS